MSAPDDATPPQPGPRNRTRTWLYETISEHHSTGGLAFVISVVTLTTVGYGDISPETPLGQFVASLIMIMGYGVIAVRTGIVSAELVRTPFDTDVSGEVCSVCGREDHAVDARFCDPCGTSLKA